ncbi:MAG: SMP-30/gluconolactonase/LRE family protein [Henriciella sp.]
MMKPILMTAAAAALVSCANVSGDEAAPLPSWSFEDASIFPADRTLVRPEDGVVLPDGTLLVADQEYGLAAVSPDGERRAFGEFAAAGYFHAPPKNVSGPNGVSLSPDGSHVLVADVFTGVIYRTDVATGETRRIYRHAYGVNTAIEDETGAIWFTHSTENAPPEGDTRLFTAIDMPMADGALFRLPPPSGHGAYAAAELKASGLFFANGVVMDPARRALYVSETMANRIIGFDVDTASGAVSNQRLVAEIIGPDNVELDASGRIWAASALGNAVIVIDPETGDATTVFHPQTDAGDALIAEWARRMEAGEPALELMAPPMWEPLPGLTTGIILTPGDGPVYVSGAGNALTRLDR